MQFKLWFTKSCIVGLVLILACQSQEKNTVEESIKRIDPADSLVQQLNLLHKAGHINGFGVSIVDENMTLFEIGVGFSDEKKTPYTHQTIQNIGSVSKTMIGVALLRAQELKMLSLDDPINKYLPFEVINPNYPDIPITIRHLATHTSSIIDTEIYDEKAYILKDPSNPSNPLSDEMAENFRNPESMEPMIVFLQRVLSTNGKWYSQKGFLTSKPGKEYEYSNIGATLAAAVLEIATETPFDQFTSIHILQPLRMLNSGWNFSDINMSRHSTLYANPNQSLPFYSLITYPDGGLITSVQDLSLYLSELISGYSGKGILLSKNSYKELFSPYFSISPLSNAEGNDDFDDEFNTGIFMGYTPIGYIGHTGGDPGIATYMFFNPKTNIGRILMINTSIVNSQGVDQFYSIWNLLGNYEQTLN